MQVEAAIQQGNLEKYLGNLLAFHMYEGHQIAVWRKPNTQTVHVLIDTSKNVKRVPPSLEELPAGFIVHPFEEQVDQKAIFLEAHVYFQVDLTKPIAEQFADKSPINLTASNAALIIKDRFVHGEDENHFKNFGECSKQEFIELVEKGIQAIRDSKLIKIVPAKVKMVDLNPEFDLVKSMSSLFSSYPNAFVNFFHIPELGSWIGASPEILIQTKGNAFYTMSLAGTQKASGDNPMKNAAWTQKEIEEQALVSRYIVDSFKKIRLREYIEQGPKTVLAGNLLHLRSDFRVDMEAANFPQLGSVMLDLLHPTSAVCGMPRQAAFDFLRKEEKFDRSLFSGYIGPVNIDGETAIFVNLRTARLLSDCALLYAGAGVTEDSDPLMEWEETEMKCEIISQHLKQ